MKNLCRVTSVKLPNSFIATSILPRSPYWIGLVPNRAVSSRFGGMGLGFNWKVDEWLRSLHLCRYSMASILWIGMCFGYAIGYRWIGGVRTKKWWSWCAFWRPWWTWRGCCCVNGVSWNDLRHGIGNKHEISANLMLKNLFVIRMILVTGFGRKGRGRMVIGRAGTSGWSTGRTGVHNRTGRRRYSVEVWNLCVDTFSWHVAVRTDHISVVSLIFR